MKIYINDLEADVINPACNITCTSHHGNMIELSFCCDLDELDRLMDDAKPHKIIDVRIENDKTLIDLKQCMVVCINRQLIPGVSIEESSKFLLDLNCPSIVCSDLGDLFLE